MSRSCFAASCLVLVFDASDANLDGTTPWDDMLVETSAQDERHVVGAKTGENISNAFGCLVRKAVELKCETDEKQEADLLEEENTQQNRKCLVVWMVSATLDVWVVLVDGADDLPQRL